jgi:hypothetical protein
MEPMEINTVYCNFDYKLDVSTVKLNYFWSAKPWIRIRIETRGDPLHGILYLRVLRAASCFCRHMVNLNKIGEALIVNL